MRLARVRLAVVGCLAVVGFGSSASAQGAPPPPEIGSPVSGYHPLAPARASSGTIAAGATAKVTLAGVGGLPEADQIRAVAVSVSARAGAKAGGVTIYNAGTSRPKAVTVSARANTRQTSMAIVRLSTAGAVKLYASARMRVSVDVLGYFDRFTFLSYNPNLSTQFSPVTPTRMVDSRVGLGHDGKFQPGETFSLHVAGVGDVPADAKAVALMLVARGGTNAGRVAALPTGTATTTALSYDGAGHAAAAMVYAAVSSGGNVKLVNTGGPVSLSVDVLGYQQKLGNNISTGQSSALAPTLVANTATGQRTAKAKIGAGKTRTITVSGIGQVPDFGVAAVALEIRTSGATKATTLSVYSADPSAIPAGTIPARPKAPQSTLTVSETSFENGQIRIHNPRGAVNVRVDVVAWYSFVIPPPPNVPPPPGDAGVSTKEISKPPMPGGVTATAHSRRQDPAKVRRFWTPKRLAAAKPLDAASGDDGTIHSSDNQPAYPHGQEGYLPGGSYSAAVGRLYYTTPEDNLGVCSATVVARNLLITAGHCIYEIQDLNHGKFGGFMSNFLFVPKQLGTSKPYGVWGASGGVVYKALCGGDCTPGNETDFFFGLDYGVIEVPPDNTNHYVGDYTSWFSIQSNPQGTLVYSAGYPAEGWFSQNCSGFDPSVGSCFVWYCYTSAGEFYPIAGADGWYEIGIGCFENGGGSGGPEFEYLGGQWRIASINSHIANITYDASGHRYYGANLWGPYLNGWAISLWNDHAIV